MDLEFTTAFYLREDNHFHLFSGSPLVKKFTPCWNVADKVTMMVAEAVDKQT